MKKVTQWKTHTQMMLFMPLSFYQGRVLDQWLFLSEEQSKCQRSASPFDVIFFCNFCLSFTIQNWYYSQSP